MPRCRGWNWNPLSNALDFPRGIPAPCASSIVILVLYTSFKVFLLWRQRQQAIFKMPHLVNYVTFGESQSTRCLARGGTAYKMALWNGLGQAATVAQLGGIDAAGLISMIVQAVQTVQRNKVECQLLANHVMLITDLLQLLEQSEMMRRPQIRRPLDGLEDTLCQAYMLVTSCQKSNVMSVSSWQEIRLNSSEMSGIELIHISASIL
ncbi:hypothetical protein PR202_gb13681 [Eleusine coracana subsp. coracana]|uniref:MCAfunc domain-containing protein n=1 Tax=Eleusine coracana subsp. coracana TaxID=191504 RepID=A0AAV5ESL3_ELECO|nr:hypothetical protein PR202_gb13681 [Eleusine coracana subsp. coracana]